jgi:DNA polymerase I-like protein with 3'-5' exonuclease and polymerase domains
MPDPTSAFTFLLHQTAPEPAEPVAGPYLPEGASGPPTGHPGQPGQAPAPTQTSGRPDLTTSGRPDLTTSGRPDLTTSGRPDLHGPQSLAQLLETVVPTRPSTIDLPMYEPPDLTGIHDIVLNFATTGLDWIRGARPVGVTVGTLDGEMIRFLPFAFEGGGNNDEAVVKRWMQEQVRGKHITNANTRFELHMARVWGVDLEAQGNTFSDIHHTAALLDDHRKRFALDTLAKDYLPHEEMVARVDEKSHASYHAYDVAIRELFSVYLVGQLREVMYPQIEAQNLRRVHDLEDAVIPVVVEMEKNGSPLDLELLDRMETECRVRHGVLMLELAQEVGFNFEHTATGWQRLFACCGLAPSDSYAEDIIGAIDHPTIRKAHFAGQLASLNSKTFQAYKKQVGSDGVLHYDIHQLRGDDGGTVSGRFSIGYVHQVPNHDNHHAVFGQGESEACGGTCDFFPRRLFIPGSDNYLEADASQIEYRLFAHLADNAEVLQAYRENPKLSFHKKTWEMFKVHIPTMLYTEQKRFNFARQYGARTVKLGVMMGVISAKEGEEIRKAKRWNDPKLAKVSNIEKIYKKVMPEGELLLDLSAHLAKATCDNYCRDDDALHQQFAHQGYVETILGRRSRFPENHKTYIGLNRRLQGSASDIMKQKLVELHRARADTGFLMRLTVHDSVLGDAQTPETVEKVEALLNEQSFDLRVPILWECGSGERWAGCK